MMNRNLPVREIRRVSKGCQVEKCVVCCKGKMDRQALLEIKMCVGRR